jgi:hyperosmotically inducible periplasmic protein
LCGAQIIAKDARPPETTYAAASPSQLLKHTTKRKLVHASRQIGNVNVRFRKGSINMSIISFRIVALAAFALLCVTGAPKASVALAQPSSLQAPDNSNQNKGQTETADNQANSKADRQITAKIRKAITSEKDLSTYAHNIKIITVNGEVTLKGPVQTDDEKQKVATLAANVVSPDKIVNELTVKQ